MNTPGARMTPGCVPAKVFSPLDKTAWPTCKGLFSGVSEKLYSFRRAGGRRDYQGKPEHDDVRIIVPGWVLSRIRAPRVCDSEFTLFLPCVHGCE